MFIEDGFIARRARQLAFVALLFATTTLADEITERSPHELRKISVTATLNEREVREVAGTVSVIDAQDIERQLVFDIKDLIRYEPGISVANAPTRFGLSGFNIRGIDGDRVLMRIDGARMSDAFAIGSFSSARRNLIDLDAVRAVEIIRGPASALYGSDAIGGVVSFDLKEPRDFLAAGERFDAAAATGYRSDDAAWFSSARFAAAGEDVAALLLMSHDEGRQLRNQGANAAFDRTRTKPNPQRSATNSVLGKLAWNVAGNQRIGVSINAQRNEVRTNVLSGVGVANGVDTLSLAGDDEQDRVLASLTHEWAGASALFERIESRVYLQQTDVEQRTFEQRYALASGPAATVARDRAFHFEQSLRGAEVLMRKTLDDGFLVHRLTYGVDLRQTQTDQLRNGTQSSVATGAVTGTIPPDVFPVRDFPKSDTRELAVYLQDEMLIGEDWTLVPGVRIDSYRLKPRVDAIFLEDNPGVSSSRLEETSVSPKLGLIVDIGDEWAVFANYARGFRAPPYDDVNIGFTNLAFGYTAIANPGLEPESSHGYELGIRGVGASAYFDASTFYNDYEDFIESLVAVGMQDGLLVFQSRNISSAIIYGAELRAGFQHGDWRVKTSLAYARGEDRETDRPLNSVDPLKAVIALGFDQSAGRWGAELAATAVRRKTNIDSAAGASFAAPSYFTFDVLGYAQLLERLRVNFGVFNLLDRKYWEWADVQGRAADDPALDRYTRPGRHARLSATYRF